jgi:homeobox protein ESX1
MIVRLPVAGFIFPQPALGTTGRLPPLLGAESTAGEAVSLGRPASAGAEVPPADPALPPVPAEPPVPPAPEEPPPAPAVAPPVPPVPGVVG